MKRSRASRVPNPGAAAGFAPAFLGIPSDCATALCLDMLTAHVYIEVNEMERGIAFYCEGLGLELKRRFSPSWAELAGANVPIFLLSNRPPVAELGSRRVPRSFERHWTPVHLDFIVPDLEKAVGRCRRLGASLDREAGEREYGRIAYLADPFGNGFDLIEFAPGGYDRLRS